MYNQNQLLRLTKHSKPSIWGEMSSVTLRTIVSNLVSLFSVLQAIDSIHQVGLYCLALVPANTLPKTPLGGIHISDTKQLFLEGALHPCNILMCPHTCVTNMPKPRQKQPGQCVSVSNKHVNVCTLFHIF